MMLHTRAFVGITLLLLAVGVAVDRADDRISALTVPVAWDYGSEPGKDSNRWVGNREVPVSYRPADCADRFRLKGVRHEYVLMDRTGKKSSPAFIVATFQKVVSGAVEPPFLEIVRPKYTKDGKRTKKTHVDTVGFRLDFPPNQIADWASANIEVTLSVPNHDVHNPFGWTEVVVTCE